MSKLSSIDNITNDVAYSDNGFVFTDTLGSFIGNSEFKKPQIDFKLGKDNSHTYIWNVLSAIGQDIGSTLYQNIKNYIDLVSNVETCKVQALGSMMKNLGFDYNINLITQTFPIEIQQIIDVMSIDKKYLVKSGLLKQSFLNDMFSQISSDSITNKQTVLSSFLSGVEYSVDSIGINDDRLNTYIEDLINNTLSSVLLQTYNITGLSNCYIYPDAINDNTVNLSFKDTDSYKFKLKNNIDLSFDEVTIADNIDSGNDNIDNYQGAELCAVIHEIDKRSQRLSLLDIQKFGQDITNISSLDTTRYNFYSKRKVREYIDFIDRQNYEFNSNFLSSELYKLDPNYYVINNSGVIDDIESIVKSKGNITRNPDIDINWEQVNSVAKHLTTIIDYIRKLRNKIRIQMQKYYLKGTNSLILYVINQYLIDYSKIQLGLQKNQSITQVLEQLNNHKQQDVEVVEYYDKTEYYNIQTDTSISSINGSRQTNSRFWENNVMNNDSQMNFTLNQIDNFYLNTMMLKCGLDNELNHEDLTGFLNTLYDIGATKAFIDKNDIFSSKINSDVFTNQIYDELTSCQNSYNILCSYLDDYSYNASLLSDQVSSIIKHIEQKLESEYMNNISGYYLTNKDKTEKLSTEIDKLSVDVENYINGQYSFYFNKSNDVNDFFIENKKYISKNITDKIQNLELYVSKQSNIKNVALIDSTNNILNTIDDVSSSLNELTFDLEKVGYQISTQYDSILEYIDSVKKYNDDMIQNRRLFITQTIESLKQQYQQMKQQFDTLNNTFIESVASYNTGSPSYTLGNNTYVQFSPDSTLSSGQTLLGTYNIKTNLENIKHITEHDMIIEPGTKGIFYSDKKGFYGKLTTIPSNYVFKDTSPLRDRCSQLSYWMERETFNGIYGLKNDGTVAVIKSTLNGLSQIDHTFKNILQQIYDVFKYDLAKEYQYSSIDDFIKSDNIENRLEIVGSFVNSKLDESVIVGDDILKKYMIYSTTINEQSKIMTNSIDNFNKICSDEGQKTFLNDFNADLNKINHDIMVSLIKYIDNKDNMSYQIIVNDILDFNKRLTQIVEEYRILSYAFADEIGYIEKDTYNIEECIKDITQKLIDSIDYNKSVGQLSVDSIINDSIIKSVSILSSKMPQDTTDNFIELSQKAIDGLNFFNNDQYNEDKKIYLTYGGQEFAYYPYYNLKNKTHSSYQIHPFLWNFVEKGSNQQNSLLKNFYSINTDELILSKISKNIDSYYGHFGNIIDKWKHYDSKDYTGYQTKYESSRHIAINNVSSEVIDYDGPFYPPAIDYLRTHDKKQCISSVAHMVTVEKTIDDIKEKFENDRLDVMNLISYNVIIDQYGNKQYVFQNDLSVQNLLSDYMIPYGEISKSLLKDTIDNFFKNNDQYYWTNTYLIDAIHSSLSPTFYELYYKQLSYENNSTKFMKIAQQIDEYWNAKDEFLLGIDEITKDHSLSDVYDIYNYGEDKNGNMYILYKKYDIENPTYKSKQNQFGQLWIRQYNNPLAFPAFSGKNPQVEISSMNAGLKILGGINDKLGATEISSQMSCFYDMMISEDMSQMILVSKNGSGLNQVQIYENPWIIYVPLDQNEDNTITMKQVGVQTDIIESGKGEQISSDLTSISPETELINYAYLGSFTNKQDDINCVYVTKSYLSSGVSLPIDGKIKIFAVKDCVITHKLESSVDFNNSISDQIVFSKFNDDGKTYLDIAYLETNNIIVSKNHITGSKVDILSNTIGPVYDDFTTNDMNSHIIFDSNVKLKRFNVTDEEIKEYGLERTYNQNADMSYIPAYPGLSGEQFINNSIISNYSEYNIELLGRSNDIEQYISRVNTNVDPYFELSTISTNDVYGRVYEEFDFSKLSSTFRSYKNKAFNKTASKLIEDIQNIEISGILYKCYIWKFNVDLTDQSFNKSGLLLINTQTYGKNPYYMAEISSIDDNVWNEVMYLHQNSLSNAEVYVHDSQYDENVNVTIIGSYDQRRMYNPVDSNEIPGINKIFFKINKSSKDLSVIYTFNDDRTYIPQGITQCIIFNDNDITQFEDYHMFDVYGFINVARGKNFNPYEISYKDIPDDGKGWGINYSSNNQNISGSEWIYYINKDGKIRLLKDVHLSDYTNLSDVYVYQGNDKLSFKYDEQDYFKYGDDLYYFPTLNTKYPRTVGNSVYMKSHNNIALWNNADQIFDDGNLFIFDMVDSKHIADNIGYVDIPIDSNNSNCLKVVEDYVVGTYDIEDPSILEVVKMNESTLSDEIHTADKITTSELIDKNDLSVMSTENDYITDIYEYERVLINAENTNLDNLCKLFVNYRKINDGQIELYFNYYNYINTPFLKIQDGKLYPEIIPSTYLKLKPGENGILNLVCQFKYNEGGHIYGIKNGTIASFMIYNTSDDKPKFVIKKLGTINKNTLMSRSNSSNIKIGVQNATFDVNDIHGEQNIIDSTINIQSNVRLNVPYHVYMEYDPSIINKIECNMNKTLSYELYDSDEGFVDILIKKPKSVIIPLNITINSENALINIGKKTIISLYTDNIKTEDGITIYPQLTDGVINVIKTNPTILMASNENNYGAYVVNYNKDQNIQDYIQPIG